MNPIDHLFQRLREQKRAAFMPFVTEELWGAMGERSHYPLITAKWPIADARAPAWSGSIGITLASGWPT